MLLASYAYLEETTEPTDEWRAAMAEHNEILRAVAEEAGVAISRLRGGGAAGAGDVERLLPSEWPRFRKPGDFFAEALIEAGLVH